MDHHPFIEARKTRVRPKKLEVIEHTTAVKRLGGRGNVYQLTKTGVRPDLGTEVYRSGWEADIARVFRCYGVDFKFEPFRFEFPIKKGTKVYIPDFYLPKTQEYVEIKGWFDDKSRIKLKRFRTYFPDDFKRLHMIISKGNKRAYSTCGLVGIPPENIMFFEDFKSAYKELPNWESNK